MSYLYLLSGENLELAEAELKGFLKSQGHKKEVKRYGKLAETEVEPKQLKRLAQTHEVAEKIQANPRDNHNIDHTIENSFAVRVENLTGEKIDKQKVEAELGSQLKNKNNSVNLEHPKTTIKAYITAEKILIGKVVQKIPRNLYKKRTNQERPFSSPISLDPKLARTLVNLSETPPGKNVLDPFCGTGGILIEAGLCGIGVHGLDIQKEMVNGSRKNLEKYGIIAHNIKKGEIKDAPKIFGQKFHAVITDLPYGKASKLEGDPVEKFLDTYKKLTEGKVVFMSNKKSLRNLEPAFEIYHHKNLTRYIYIV